MWIVRRAFGVCLLFWGLLVGANMAQAQSALSFAACPFTIPAGQIEGQTIYCAYLSVPEDRSSPQSQSIQLAVAIVRSPSADPLPDPVVYLAGGPGSNALSDVESWLDMPFLAKRDLILVDQRGTGYSQPRLACPELHHTDNMNLGTQLCRDRLTGAGINLAAYNSAESAADMNDLRLALGVEEWNLLGISYGTRLVLTILRDYPTGVRSVILDSSYPPQVNAYEEHPLNGVKAFETLFADCALHVACNLAYPNLGTTFYDLVLQLNHTPARYRFVDPLTQLPLEQIVTGDMLVDQVFRALYSTQAIRYLPYGIDLMHQGKYELGLAVIEGKVSGEVAAAALSGVANAPLQIQLPILDTVSDDITETQGVYNSVQCREEMPFNNVDRIFIGNGDLPMAVRDGLLGKIEAAFETCSIWNVSAAGPIETQPVYSAVPALVLAGQYDPITPPAWGERAVENLSQGYYFKVPGAGHAVIDAGECPRVMVASFLDNPVRPDASCLSRMAGPQFFIIKDNVFG